MTNRALQEFAEGRTHIVFGKDSRQSLSDKMLSFPLRAYIMRTKSRISELLSIIVSKLPEPTKQNCHHPNTLVWFDIWDRFLEMENNPGKESLFRAIRKAHLIALQDRIGWWSHLKAIKRVVMKATRKLWLIEHEHDHSYYGVRQDIFLEMWLDEVLKGNYKPRSLDYPNQCWKSGPDIRGAGFHLIQHCYSQKRQGKEIDANKIKELIDEHFDT